MTENGRYLVTQSNLHTKYIRGIHLIILINVLLCLQNSITHHGGLYLHNVWWIWNSHKCKKKVSIKMFGLSVCYCAFSIRNLCEMLFQSHVLGCFLCLYFSLFIQIGLIFSSIWILFMNIIEVTLVENVMKTFRWNGFSVKFFIMNSWQNR